MRIKNRLIVGDEKNTILLYGEIGEVISATDIKAEILQAESNGKTIEMRINSLGGDVYSGLAIIEAIRQSNADIRMFIDGVAASMASVIAMCGRHIEMGRYSRLMLHAVSAGCYGNTNEMLQCIQEMKKTENLLCEIISRKCNKTAEEIKSKYFDGEDHWLSAKEALGIGLIDGIFDMEKIQEPTTENIYNITNKRKGVNLKDDYRVFKLHLSRILSLDGHSDETEILNAINRLKTGKNGVLPSMIDNAVKKGWISQKDKDAYISLLRNDTKAFLAKYEVLKNEDAANVIELISEAQNKGIILACETDVYKSIGDEMGANVLCDILRMKPRPKRAARYLNLDFSDRSEWTYDDWRNFDPKGLAENPELYRLLKNKRTGKTMEARSLDWYRKNNPEYLEQHPDYYKSLINKEYNKQ